jgi:hypothetical protein
LVPSAPHFSVGAQPARPSRWWPWAIAGAVGLLAVALVGVVAWAISSAAESTPVAAISTKPPAAIDAFVSREYPAYKVLDSLASGRGSYTGLPGARYLLRATGDQFPRTLDVEISAGKLTDLELGIREEYVQVDEFVSDDGAFSVAARKLNHLTDTDLATMGQTFDEGKLGSTPVINNASYDVEDNGMTFVVAPNASVRPSLDDKSLDPSLVVQIYRDDPGSPWDPVDASPLDQ